MFRPAKQFEPVDGYNPYADKNELHGYEQWGSAFADSRSPEETAWLKQQIDDENEDRRVLSEAGGEGVLASIAAGVVTLSPSLRCLSPVLRAAQWPVLRHRLQSVQLQQQRARLR
jgi:hypothetical protein